ncbi:transient receptor potential cation channel subfamily V member 1-like [Haliotis cracherodii]|uniref:transient receptor potential cation channel subfamily V member 1-like n=1 Tax=Haliotis cracherodii TaxID=6455 RepID=UPI0039E79074
MRRQKHRSIALGHLPATDYAYPEDAGFCGACSRIPPTHLPQTPSFSDLLGEEVTEDEFQQEVAVKTRTLLIGRQEAEREVVMDRLVDKYGDKEKALMFVVSEFPTEYKVQLFVNMLLQRGANPSTCDSAWQTPLHHAVKRNFKGVCSKLLENDALPHVRDKNNNMPYHLALNNNNDDIAALILSYMPNAVIRDMYITRTSTRSEFNLHDLLRKEMQHAAMGVLDCMMDPIGDTGHVRVFYHVLEADEEGRPPTHQDFEDESKSCLNLIAKGNLKEVVFHDCVRLLIRRKWKKYARFRFVVNSIIYCFTLLCLTFSLAVATLTPDPAQYPDPRDKVRAATELWTCGAVAFSLVLEINQMRRHRLDYWRDMFNWLDLTSSCLLLSVIPLRFTHTQEQWQVFSVGYLLWTLKIFKFAAVFRQTGAYALILKRILGHDFVQFTVLFSVILLAFSGSFILALRGENSLQVHSETGTFWEVMFTGVRILIESEPVVTYYGQGGYSTLSCIILVIFLFTCIVVLLNILIAQLSDTYQNVQTDAQRALELNRAWIIARVELNSIYMRRSYRIRKYCESEVVSQPHDLLERWESPPLNEMNKNIRDIWVGSESNTMNLLTVKNRLTRQEKAILKMQQSLDEILASLALLHRDGDRQSLSASVNNINAAQLPTSTSPQSVSDNEVFITAAEEPNTGQAEAIESSTLNGQTVPHTDNYTESSSQSTEMAPNTDSQTDGNDARMKAALVREHSQQ